MMKKQVKVLFHLSFLFFISNEFVNVMAVSFTANSTFRRYKKEKYKGIII